VPYSALALGTLLVVWFVRRYRHAAPAAETPAPDDAALGRYREQIEQDLAHLD
jgi:hypothetical protein